MNRRILLHSIFITIYFIGWNFLLFPQEPIWEQTNGPFGANVSCMAIAPNGNIIAGTFDRGLYRSSDNGDTWESINTGLNYDTYVHSIGINNSGDIFFSSWLVYRSVDNGESWMPTGWSYFNGYEGVINIDTSGILYISTDYGLFRSIDNGDTWINLRDSLGVSPSEFYTVAAHPDGYLFASLEYRDSTFTYHVGLFRSADNGNNWVLVQNFENGLGHIVFNANGDIFATNDNELFYSSDNGDHWTDLDFTIDTDNYEIKSLGIDSENQLYIGVINFDSIYHYSVSSWIYRSVDGGLSWEPTNFQAIVSPYINLTILPGPNQYVFAGIGISSNDLYYSSVRGIFRSGDDGNSWALLNDGIINTNITSLTVAPNGNIFAGTHSNGAFRSFDFGESWTRVDSGLTESYIRCLAANDSSFIFAGTENGLYRSIDNGAYWMKLDSGLFVNNEWSHQISALAVTSNQRSEEHTSELQSHSFISYAVFCLKKKKNIEYILQNKKDV